MAANDRRVRTLERLTFSYASVDAGVKYRGNSFVAEYYWRNLGNFLGTFPIRLDGIYDHGFMAQAMRMVIPKTLGVHATTGYVCEG